MLWGGLISLAFAVAGVWVCRRIASRLPQPTLVSLQSRARHLYFAIPLLLILPSLSIYITANPSLHWDLPWFVQRHYSALHWSGISCTLAYVFGFCGAAAFLTGHRGRWYFVGFAVAALLAVQAFAHFKTKSDRPTMAAARLSPDGVVLQSSSATCVPASGANITLLLGVHTSERELADLFHTTREGTFPAQALAGMEQMGIRGRKVTLTDGDATRLKPPAMLFILGDTHAVTYVNSTNGIIELWDPSSGKRFIPQRQMRDLWQGHAIEFYR